MVLSRYQFTIGQLGNLIFMSAVVFWTMRVTGGTAVLFIFPAIDSVVLARTKALGTTGSTFYRFLALLGFAIAYCTYFHFFPSPEAIRNGAPAFLVYSVFVTASVWSAVVSRIWWAVFMGRGYRMPPTDDSCGPIAWQGFGDGPEPLTGKRGTDRLTG